MSNILCRLQVEDDEFDRKKFALMAIGMSKGGDMRDPRDTYQNQLVPMVVEQTSDQCRDP